MGDAAETVIDLKREIKRCPECNQRLGAEATFCPFDGTRLAVATWEASGDGLLGTIVDGRYEVCSVLGEGGMGTVYKVRHTSLDRHFAMKVLRRDLAREADLAARFTQEARATAIIKHPNVVAISDFGRLKDDTPYFVMELLVGQPLSMAIKNGGPLEPGVAVKIILKIASALAAAHEAGVVHRDLKPENVFLIESPSTLPPPELDVSDVRIVDFGAAMVMGASRLTKAGIVFGTPHYMSPEQASGGAVDHRTDVYALGVIMYEMFTGRVPFEADTYMGVLTQHMFVNPAPPSRVAPQRAEQLGALEDVTLRALEKKPDMRFASMNDLHQEVERLVRFDEDGAIRVAAAGAGARTSFRPPRPVPKMLGLPSPEEVDALLEPKMARSYAMTAVIAAVFTVLAGGLFFFLRGPSSRGGLPVASPSVSIAALAPAPAPIPTPAQVAKRTVRIVSTPSADVWLASPAELTRVGVTPLELVVFENAPAHRYTLRSVGYEDSEVVIDVSARSPVEIDLRKLRTSSPHVEPVSVPLTVQRPSSASPTASPRGAALPPRPSVTPSPLGGDFIDPWKK